MLLSFIFSSANGHVAYGIFQNYRTNWYEGSQNLMNFFFSYLRFIYKYEQNLIEKKNQGT